MKRPWEAEIVVTPAVVTRVVQSQLPDLAGQGIEFIGSGWDNDAYRLGDIVIRFPRRHVAVDMVRFEAAVLDRLPRDLLLQVPRLHLVGKPSDAYPYPFLAYQMVKGTPVCDTPGVHWDRADASALGQFLRMVHQVPVSVGKAFRGDTLRKADVAFRLGKCQEVLAELPEDALGVPKPDILRAAVALSQTTAAQVSALVHGDLYSRHVLVDGSRLSGVIDWGDSHVGDPALDLSIAYTLLPSECEGPFFDAYGGVDQGTRERAMFRAVFYCVVLADFGVGNDDPPILETARFTARRILETIESSPGKPGP